MRLLIVLGLVVLLFAALVIGALMNVPELMLAGFCLLPVGMFSLGYTFARWRGDRRVAVVSRGELEQLNRWRRTAQ